jgi:hypothetical protein
MPLGGVIWEESSKAVAQKIKDVTEKGISEEVSYVGEIQGNGRLKGKKARVIGNGDYLERLKGDITTGTACGVLMFEDGAIVPYKAVGIGKLVRNSPVGLIKLLSLLWVVDPPPEFDWMRNTLILWDAVTDPKTHTVKATAYEWT